MPTNFSWCSRYSFSETRQYTLYIIITNHYIIESDLIILPLVIFQYNLVSLGTNEKVDKFSDECLQTILFLITAIYKIYYINKKYPDILCFFSI